jgi:general secretion pathway protein L
MTTLIITLPLAGADAAALYDYVLSTNGLAVSAHASVPLALLPTAHDEVVALVPAQALSWHQVTLPAGSVPRAMSGERARIRLRSILESVLEDQLLDDPAQLHLALQPLAASGMLVWVAACDRAWLKAALSALAQAGHEVTRIVPEFTPQALQDTVVVTGDADHPHVAGLRRLAAAEGAAAGSAPALGLLVGPLTAPALLWLGETTAPGAVPNLPHVVAEPAVAALAEDWFKRPVTLLQHAERLLQAAQTPWDMAQFDLAHANRDRRWARVTQSFTSFLRAPQWRMARLALVAGVLVNLIGLNAWALREQASLNAKRQTLRAVLLDTFPKVPVVVDAPLQMAREVAALQRASGAAAGTDLESMLASFSAAAPAEYAATAIEFSSNELRLKGTEVSESAAVTAKLKRLGLRASQQGEQWLIAAGGQP